MRSILLVDSDPDTREIYAEYMRARGCTILTALSGDEAPIRITSRAREWPVPTA